MNKKINRNDPCHCGSKKKYKKCCWSKEVAKEFKASKINFESSKFTNAFSNAFKNAEHIDKTLDQLKNNEQTTSLKDRINKEI